jgi:hypothetical protein
MALGVIIEAIDCVGIFNLHARAGRIQYVHLKVVRIDHSAGGGCVCRHDADLGMEGALRAGGDMARQELSPCQISDLAYANV